MSEREELAEVIHKRYPEVNGWYLADVILASDVVAKMLADVWDEGANAAVEPHNTGTRMTLKAVIPFPENPYR